MPNNAPTENHSFDATAISTINQISAILIDTKIFLYLANGIILLLGIGLLVYGIYGCRLPGPQLHSCQTSVPMGVLTCLLTFLWFLAYRLNQLPLHFIYLILLICVIASQLVFAFRTLVVGNEAVIKSHLRNLYKLRKDTGEIHKEVEEFQTRLNCCGFDGPHGILYRGHSSKCLPVNRQRSSRETQCHYINFRVLSEPCDCLHHFGCLSRGMCPKDDQGTSGVGEYFRGHFIHYCPSVDCFCFCGRCTVSAHLYLKKTNKNLIIKIVCMSGSKCLNGGLQGHVKITLDNR